MIGDALFLSLAASAGRWNRRFAAPRWQATARRLDEILPLLQAAEDHARNGAWTVLALAYEAAPAFDPGLAVQAPAPGTPLAFAAAYDEALPLGPAGLPAPRLPHHCLPTESGRNDGNAPPSSMAGQGGCVFWTPEAPPSDPISGGFTPAATWGTRHWRALVSRQDYDRALAVIRDNIRRGEVYQVNYTLPLQSRLTDDPEAWFAALAAHQGAAYNACLDLGTRRLLSFSPELFFSRSGETVTVRPMKGTLPRGRTPEEDTAQAAALAACPKNQAENRMITDLLRNDLGRIARPGSVRVPELFTVERLCTAWQMTSTVVAEVPARIGLVPLLRALFPCGSITGAPKQSAMRLIRRLEPHPRGFYTGTIGQIAPGGQDCIFSVVIRTVELDAGTGLARFGVGGGITYDSRARDEYAECRTKAAFLSLPPAPFELLETLRLDRGRFTLLDEHLARLAQSAGYFGFNHDAQAVIKALEAERAAWPTCRRRVRLLVARDGTARTESFALGGTPKRPVRLGLGKIPVDSRDPYLFHKTTRRALYDAALAAHPDCDDVLLRNGRGEVTESCRANLVAAIHGRLVTPTLDCGLLLGTYRQRLMRRGIIHEAVLAPDDLARATRLWLVNSVRLWQPAVLVVT